MQCVRCLTRFSWDKHAHNRWFNLGIPPSAFFTVLIIVASANVAIAHMQELFADAWEVPALHAHC